MIEYETKGQEKLTRICPKHISQSQFIKDQTTQRLKPAEDGNGPLRENAFARLVNTYDNSCMLIEMNSVESAVWMNTYPSRIIEDILGCKVKILGRTYPVMARFMPVSFEISPERLEAIVDEGPHSHREPYRVQAGSRTLQNNQKFKSSPNQVLLHNTSGSQLVDHRTNIYPGVKTNYSQEY